MIGPKLGWILTILISVMMVACSIGVPDQSQDSIQPSTTTQAAISKQSDIAMDRQTTHTTSSPLKDVLKRGMAYADFRELLLDGNWTPLVDPQCRINVVGGNHEALCSKNSKLTACRLCEQIPELSTCSGDGYCLMRFKNVVDGRALEVTSYGMIEDWSVPGGGSRLQISQWALSGSGSH